MAKTVRKPIEAGARVRKRGQGHLGTVAVRSPRPGWIKVAWDVHRAAPLWCHEGELEAVE